MGYHKIMVYGESNSGKSTAASTLKDSYTFVRDAKKCSFPIDHRNLKEFSSIDELIADMEAGLAAYNKKYKKEPNILVIDSISRIVTEIEDLWLGYHTDGRKDWACIRADINKIIHYIDTLNKYMNLVLICHCFFNPDTRLWEETTKGSINKKNGGLLSTVDHSIQFSWDKVGDQRKVQLKNSPLCRSTIADKLEDGLINVEDFSLQNYFDKLEELNLSNYEI